MPPLPQTSYRSVATGLTSATQLPVLLRKMVPAAPTAYRSPEVPQMLYRLRAVPLVGSVVTVPLRRTMVPPSPTAQTSPGVSTNARFKRLPCGRAFSQQKP